MHDLPVHVHEVDGAVAVHRREQGVARLRARRVVGDEPGPHASSVALFAACPRDRDRRRRHRRRDGEASVTAYAARPRRSDGRNP